MREREREKATGLENSRSISLIRGKKKWVNKKVDCFNKDFKWIMNIFDDILVHI